MLDDLNGALEGEVHQSVERVAGSALDSKLPVVGRRREGLGWVQTLEVRTKQGLGFRTKQGQSKDKMMEVSG